MKKKLLALAALGLIMLTSCEKKSEEVVVDDQTITAEVEENEVMDNDSSIDGLNLTFSPTSDSNLSGTAQFTQEGDEVTMVVNLSGLTPGTHAIHIHEKGDCSSPDGKSAGGHWNPSGDEHGKFEVGSFHMGDIGNLEADSNGTATLTFKTDKWCIGCDDVKKNILGHAIIIHEGADDFSSQPSGNAGNRIGCVAIEK